MNCDFVTLLQSPSGCTVELFNPSTRNCSGNWTRERMLVGYPLTPENDFIQVKEPLWILSPFRLFLGLFHSFCFLQGNTLSIHYLVECMQKCPQQHVQNQVEETDKFKKKLLLLIYTSVSYKRDLKQLSIPRYIISWHYTRADNKIKLGQDDDRNPFDLFCFKSVCILELPWWSSS